MSCSGTRGTLRPLVFARGLALFATFIFAASFVTGCGEGHIGEARASEAGGAPASQAGMPDCGGKECGPDGCGGSCGVCAAGDLCDASGTCSTRNTELVFWSDWRTATGTSNNAILDGGKWAGSYGSPEVVSASGLGFPAEMDNVAWQYFGGDAGGAVSVCNGWASPAIGEAVAYRVYVKNSVNNPGGYIDGSSNHPLEPGAGDIAFVWDIKFGVAGDSSFTDWQMWFQSGPQTEVYDLGGTVPSGSVWVVEWSFERVTSNTFRTRSKFSDINYNTVAEFDSGGTTTSGLNTNAGDIVCGSSHALRSLLVGWNGPYGWSNVTGAIYWGGVAVALTAPGQWIGPYPIGPETN